MHVSSHGEPCVMKCENARAHIECSVRVCLSSLLPPKVLVTKTLAVTAMLQVIPIAASEAMQKQIMTELEILLRVRGVVSVCALPRMEHVLHCPMVTCLSPQQYACAHIRTHAIFILHAKYTQTGNGNPDKINGHTRSLAVHTHAHAHAVPVATCHWLLRVFLRRKQNQNLHGIHGRSVKNDSL